MFNLAGIIEEGTTAIGVHSYGGTQRLVAVCLAKDLSDNKRKELEARVLLNMVEPDIALSDHEHGTLSENFSRSTENTLTVPVHHPDSAELLIEQVLPAEGFRKVLFVCDDEDAYIAMCANLGMSRQDFMRFGKLKTMVEADDDEKHNVLGSAHKLIEAIKSGQLSTPWLEASSRAQRGMFDDMIENIINAEKFYVPITELEDDVVGNLKFAKADYSLPFPNCFIEYEFFGQDSRTRKTIQGRGLMRAYETEDGEYHSELFNYNRETGEFMHLGFGPKWRMNSDGELEYLGTWKASPNVDILFGQKIQDRDGNPTTMMENRAVMALKRVGPTLSSYNNPHYRVTHHLPPEKLQRKREKQGRTPFLEHHVVSPRPATTHPHTTSEEAGAGTGNPLPLRAVRRHFKPSQGIWVNAYLQGDPRYGIDVHSFSKLRNQHNDDSSSESGNDGQDFDTLS